jgi:hypothetical protein
MLTNGGRVREYWLGYRATDWKRIAEAHDKGAHYHNHSVIVFHRFSKPIAAPIHFIYDEPYVAPVSMLVALLCKRCDRPELAILHSEPGVLAPEIIDYQCREHVGSRRTYNGSLRKQFPYAYVSFCAMRQRCWNPNATGYENYGGRGITICERWAAKDGFARFVEDLGERPWEHSIDRINVDGNYEPGNCRWATDEMQAMNKRTTEECEKFTKDLLSGLMNEETAEHVW